MSDSYRGATQGELLGAPLARRVAATSASPYTPARRGGRPALEIHAGGSLIDVMVAVFRDAVEEILSEGSQQ